MGASDPHSFEWNELYNIIYVCLNHDFPEGKVTSSNNHHAASKVGELERVHVMKPADQLTQRFRTTIRSQHQLRLSKGYFQLASVSIDIKGRH